MSITARNALLSRRFFFSALFSVLVTAIVNALVDYKIGELSVVGSYAVIDVLIFTSIVALLTYVGGGKITSQIIEGKSGAPLPVCGRSLSQSIFSLAFMNGQRSAAGFVFFCCTFPGMLVAGALMGLCNRFHGGIPCNAPNIETKVLLTVLWKVIVATIIFALDYLGACDDRQPAIQEWCKQKGEKKQ